MRCQDMYRYRPDLDPPYRFVHQYLKLAETNSDRIVVIDGQEDIDTIHKNIWKEFEKRLLEK